MSKPSSFAAKAAGSAFIALLISSLTPAGAHADPSAADPGIPAFSALAAVHEGEKRYIVKYGDDVNSEAQSEALRQQGIAVTGTLSHTVKASVVVATPEEAELLKSSDDVASVELDTPVSISSPTSLWGLDRIDQRSGRDGEYTIGDGGAGVDVYVVDTGLNQFAR